MNTTLKCALAATLVVMVQIIFAQQGLRCGTTEAMNQLMATHPEVKARLETMNEEVEKIDKEAYKNGYKNQASLNERLNNINAVSSVTYTIPVVFHILHTNGSENISNEQCIDAIRIMNRDYAKLNPDTSVTVSSFKSIASVVGIHFTLATIDPNGNCTNGIERYYDANTNWVQSSPGFNYTWNPTKYLNIYVVKSISSGSFKAAAYTYLPGSWPSGSPNDCIVALYTYVGSIGASNVTDSRTLTHEAGHWFNLQHPWGNNNSAGQVCGDDGVTDTPVTAGSDLVCNTSLSNCNPPIIENVQNYMDYSYCSTMFTQGQVTRMRNTIVNNTGNVGRPNVVTVANLAATGVTNPIVCAPSANFFANKNLVCSNSTVTFKDSTINTHVTGWNWSFEGGVPATSTDSMPVITYATPGVYAVSYTATNSAGDSSLTKSSYITVNNSTATYQSQYTEGFETITIPNTDWTIDNPTNGGIAWAENNITGSTGTHCVELANISNTAGSTCGLYSPSFNVSAIFQSNSMTKLSFDVAYQQKTTSSADKLQIFTSTDCGQTWVSRYVKFGAALSTAAAGTADFVPTATQWRTDQVNVNPVLGATNVMFKFLFIADPTAPGNNIYIDNINLPGLATGIENITAAQINLQVYPNPTTQTSYVAFELDGKHAVAISVTDVLGSQVEKVVASELATGNYKYAIGENAKLSSGVYFMNLSIDGKLITKKIIIQ